MSIEDKVLHFVHRLFAKHIQNESIYRGYQSQQDVIWLGKLALLHLGGVWWDNPDGLQFLDQLIDEHKQLFGFH
jgi:hypothetical protein